jgi:hypothetical protein
VPRPPHRQTASMKRPEAGRGAALHFRTGCDGRAGTLGSHQMVGNVEAVARLRLKPTKWDGAIERAQRLIAEQIERESKNGSASAEVRELEETQTGLRVE